MASPAPGARRAWARAALENDAAQREAPVAPDAPDAPDARVATVPAMIAPTAVAFYDPSRDRAPAAMAEEELVDRLLDRMHDRLRDEALRRLGITGGTL